MRVGLRIYSRSNGISQPRTLAWWAINSGSLERIDVDLSTSFRQLLYGHQSALTHPTCRQRICLAENVRTSEAAMSTRPTKRRCSSSRGIRMRVQHEHEPPDALIQQLLQNSRFRL